MNKNSDDGVCHFVIVAPQLVISEFLLFIIFVTHIQYGGLTTITPTDNAYIKYFNNLNKI